MSNCDFSAKDKVFIYSPFEKSEKAITWVKSETNIIELVFNNPLDAVLKIHHVSLIVEGDSAPFVTPVAFKIQPKSKATIEMVCKSEIVGDFTLKAEVAFFSEMKFHVKLRNN